MVTTASLSQLARIVDLTQYFSHIAQARVIGISSFIAIWHDCSDAGHFI